MFDEFGIRLKKYEKESSTKLLNEDPVIIRVDGRAFHTVAKGFEKPFDMVMIKSNN